LSFIAIRNLKAQSKIWKIDRSADASQARHRLQAPQQIRLATGEHKQGAVSTTTDTLRHEEAS